MNEEGNAVKVIFGLLVDIKNDIEEAITSSRTQNDAINRIASPIPEPLSPSSKRDEPPNVNWASLPIIEKLQRIQEEARLLNNLVRGNTIRLDSLV